MKKYLLYPVGYHPMSALGLNLKLEITEEESNRHKEMEKQAVEVKLEDDQNPPVGQWSMEIV